MKTCAASAVTQVLVHGSANPSRSCASVSSASAPEPVAVRGVPAAECAPGLGPQPGSVGGSDPSAAKAAVRRWAFAAARSSHQISCSPASTMAMLSRNTRIVPVTHIARSSCMV